MWGLSTISFLITLLTPYTSLGCQFQTNGCVKIEGKQVVFPNITYEGFVLLNGNLQLSKTNTCMFAVLNLVCLWANGSPRDLKYFQDSPADLKYFYDSHGDSKYVEVKFLGSPGDLKYVEVNFGKPWLTSGGSNCKHFHVSVFCSQNKVFSRGSKFYQPNSRKSVSFVTNEFVDTGFKVQTS